MERAQRDYVWTMSTLQQLSKDKLISLLEGGLDRYEDYSEALLKHKHEVMRNRTTFPDRYQPQVLETIDCLDKAADNVDRTIKLLTEEGDRRQLRTSKIVLESLIQPIFDGQVEADSLTWPEFEKNLHEYLEAMDVSLDQLTLEYMKRFFIGEPKRMMNTFGYSTLASTCLDKMRNEYSSENYILKSILRILRTLRIPHYNRCLWKQVEDRSLLLANLLKKVPNGEANFEILDGIERSLPLEKKEHFLYQTRPLLPDQKLCFSINLLKEIAEFGSLMNKKFGKARSYWSDPDDEVHDEDSNSDAEDSDASPEDEIDLEDFLEECRLEEEEWQRRVRIDEEEERRALVVPSDEEEENRDEGHSFYFY